MNAGPARSGSGVAPLVGAPIVQAAPTPADKPAAASAQPLANRFAELLKRNRAEAAKPSAPVPAHAAPAEANASAQGNDASAIEAKAAPTNAAKARAATPKATLQPPAAGDGGPEDATSGTVSSEHASDETEASDRSERPSASPASADGLDSRAAAAAAVDALRRVASTSCAATDDAAGSTTEARDGAGAATDRTLGHARGVASVDAANDRHATAVDAGRDSALRATLGAAFTASPTEPAASLDSPPAPPAHERPVDALTAALGVGPPPPGTDGAAATSPSTALALATPIDAPDFSASLAVRVSLLVHDGVQQAELHLNPAETGPVSIHISVDGTAARVDFGADLAATRAAIERGLPELASALRDAGFTLAGGGVSQHAGSRASGDDDRAGSTGHREENATSVSTAIAAESRRAVRAIASGRVDLYA
jgi:flagellar hook-length control protein FliK